MLFVQCKVDLLYSSQADAQSSEYVYSARVPILYSFNRVLSRWVRSFVVMCFSEWVGYSGFVASWLRGFEASWLGVKGGLDPL